MPQGSVGRGSTGWVAAQPWGAGPLDHCPGERSWGAGRGTRDPEEGCRGPGRAACLAWPLPPSAGDPTSSCRLGFLRGGCHAWQEALGLAGAAAARWVPSAAGRGWPWPPAADVHLKVGLAEPPFAPAALVTNTNV